MVESEALQHEAPRPENVLLDPIRQAIRSFVGSVEASSKEMTVAAERFALDSAQLIRTASTAHHHTRRAAHQERDVANLQRSTSAVTEAASQAAATAREAAGAVSPGENNMSEAETSPQRPADCSARRGHQHPTGLLQGEVYDCVGSYLPPPEPLSTPSTLQLQPRAWMRLSHAPARSELSSGIHGTEVVVTKL